MTRGGRGAAGCCCCCAGLAWAAAGRAWTGALGGVAAACACGLTCGGATCPFGRGAAWDRACDGTSRRRLRLRRPPPRRGQRVARRGTRRLRSRLRPARNRLAGAAAAVAEAPRGSAPPAAAGAPALPDAAAAGPPAAEQAAGPAADGRGRCRRAADWARSPPIPPNHARRPPQSRIFKMRMLADFPCAAHYFRRNAPGTQDERKYGERLDAVRPFAPHLIQAAALTKHGGRSATHWCRRSRTSSTAPH